ncbi:MAG: hypothetical protein ABSG57_09065 [Candidatus Bathyarchaeia archaeon]
MSEGRRRFSDLTRQEKVWVVGGIAEVFFMLAVFLLYYQFFMVGDVPPFHIVGLMNAGKILTAIIVLAPSFFLIVEIPAMILFGTIACYFAHQSASDTLKLMVFALALFAALPIAFILALLSLLDLFFSTAPVAFQTILMILTLFTSVAVAVRMLKFKKIQELLKFR